MLKPSQLITIAIFLGSFLFILFFKDQNGGHLSSSVSAYPPSNKALLPTTPPYPIPTEALTQNQDPPVGFNPTEFIYLPIMFDPAPAQFSVAGANANWLPDVVPQGLEIDPYIWDKIPNNNSSIQMIRSCTYYRERTTLSGPWRIRFYSYYKANQVGHFCWDPINEKFAEIVDHPACPETPCLDVSVAVIPNAGEDKLRGYIRDNPNWIWLVGNEPDNISQDAMVTTISLANGGGELHVGGPESYALFFKQFFDLVAFETDTHPRLVFCQATYAYDNPDEPDIGTGFCRQAFASLNTLGYGAAHIFALSSHQYLDDEEIDENNYSGGKLLDGESDAFPSDPVENRSILKFAVEEIWQKYLEEFENWAISEEMGDKPLWLTEFGSLAAWCYEDHVPNHLRIGIDHEGGLLCDTSLSEPVFYGRNNREGLWGLQTLQIDYLSRPDNGWSAAWWFVSKMGDFDGNGRCDQTAWVWGDNFDCLRNSTNPDNLSRAGITYNQTLDWVIKQSNPPITITTTAINPSQSTSLLPLDSNEYRYCKDTIEILCSPTEQAALIGEYGKVDDALTHINQTIYFTHDYQNPVVFVSPASRDGADVSVVRIIDVQTNHFVLHIDEAPNHGSGWHTTESVNYLVLEAGEWYLSDDTKVEVGLATTNATVGTQVASNWHSVNFNTTFSASPIVLSQVQTIQDASWVKTRHHTITPTGFQLVLEEAESSTTAHGIETIGWFAIEEAQGNWSSNLFESFRTASAVNHNWYSLTWQQPYGQPPLFWANLATYNGSDHAGLRFDRTTWLPGGVQIMVEEDTTQDSEIWHVSEAVGVLVIEGYDLLYGYPP